LELNNIMGDTDFQTVYLIPHKNNQYIVYLPIHGIIFLGNTSAINLFYNALNGDNKAQSSFGLTPRQVAKIRTTESKSQTDKKGHFHPTTVTLFLTTNCSLKCKYCYANAGESNVHIKKKYIEIAVSEVIKNALESGRREITVVYHGGGDIGVVWDLVEETTEYILGLARNNKLAVKFNAGLNGVLSDHQRDWIVNNINSATISIDGTRDIQNKLRPFKNGNPSFDLVNNTLKYFDEHSFKYAIRSTITAETVDRLEEITTFFCQSYKVTKIKMEPVFIQGRAFQSNVCAPSADDFVKHFIRAQKIAMLYGRELLYSGARFDMLTEIFCMAAGSSFGVTPEGYITSCYEVLDKANPLSDVFFYGKIEGGKVVYFQNKLRKLAKLNVFEKKKCMRCFAKFHCAGDCPAKSILYEKEEIDQNYRCIINRELTKEQLLRSIK